MGRTRIFSLYLASGFDLKAHCRCSKYVRVPFKSRTIEVDYS